MRSDREHLSAERTVNAYGGEEIMKKLAVLLFVVALVPAAFASDLSKAREEGKANFYANITAVEPVITSYSIHYTKLYELFQLRSLA